MPNDVSDGAVGDAPTAGVMLARGAGYGALFGGVCGLFIAPVTDLVTFTDERFDPATFLLGVFTAPVAACYGLVAGLGAASVVALVPNRRLTPNVARWSAALVGPMIVAAIGWWLFRPSLTPGDNETSDHVAETLMIAYIYPCVTAFGVALVGGPRLVAPVRNDDSPSWSIEETPRRPT